MKSGQEGGMQFGTISAIHVIVLDIYPSQLVRDLVRSDVRMRHGDSGGPIVAYSDHGNLYGIVATHDFWGRYHTPIDQITSEMGVTAVLN